jgi:hypothetical protein
MSESKGELPGGEGEGIEGVRARSEPGNLVVAEKPDTSIGCFGNGRPGQIRITPGVNALGELLNQSGMGINSAEPILFEKPNIPVRPAGDTSQGPESAGQQAAAF